MFFRDSLCLPCKVWVKEIKAMKKIKYMVFVLSLVAAVGISYATATLRNMPEAFDWEEENEPE